MYADLEEANWIPVSFQDAARNLAREVVNRYVKGNQVVGLGSGPMAAAIVREMANAKGKSSAKKVVIAAESNKFVSTFSWPVPIEVHPYAIHSIRNKLERDAGGRPKMRMLKEAYPYVTENGNFILDTAFAFNSISDIRQKEIELKGTPGVVEVGLFTILADAYCKANEDGSFEIIEV